MLTLKQSNFLKLFAVFLMVIDHIGAYLIPVPFFRILGRLVFPIFAYQLTVGYEKTSDKKKYFQNLLIFAFISHIPYSLLGNNQLNIIFSLLFGFCLLWLLDNDFYLSSFFVFLIGSFICIYGAYGLVLILLFRYYSNYPVLLAFLFALLNVFYWAFYGSTIQFFSLLALIPLFVLKLPKIDLNKYFFYVFYPLHLLIIYFFTLYV
jgi:hypothetical protein